MLLVWSLKTCGLREPLVDARADTEQGDACGAEGERQASVAAYAVSPGGSLFDLH